MDKIKKVSLFKRYLIAGLLIWLPIWATLLVIKFLIDIMDSSMSLLPRVYQPDYLVGFHIPGLGLVFSLVIVFFSGMIFSNFLGRHLVAFWESILTRIPIVRSVYGTVKQVLEALFSTKGQSFQKVLLVEWPRKGLYTVAFQTGDMYPPFNDILGQEMVNIFVPTTPNPTAGFLMMIPKAEAIELNMSVEDALKWIVSLGVIQPDVAKKLVAEGVK